MMTVEEALQMLDNICAQVSLNREGHMKLQQALNVVRSKIAALERTVTDLSEDLSEDSSEDE